MPLILRNILIAWAFLGASLANGYVVVVVIPHPWGAYFAMFELATLGAVAFTYARRI